MNAAQPAGRTPCIQEVRVAADILAQAGFAPPEWTRVAEAARPQQPAERKLGEPLRGWQREASKARDQQEEFPTPRPVPTGG